MADVSLTAAIDALFALADEEAQTAWLVAYSAAQMPDTVLAFAEALKAKTDEWRSTTAIQQALHGIHLLYTLAAHTQNSLLRAIALRADGNTRLIGLGEFQVALRLYDEAAAIYRAAGYQADAAGAQVGKVWALAMLEAYDEIATLEAELPPVLEASGRWQILANFYLNLGAVYGRIAQDGHALTLLDKAKSIYRTLGDQVNPANLAMVDNSRAIHLRNLGAFAASIAASESACEQLHRLALEVEAANAEQTLAVTYLYLGRYNDALQLFDRARSVFLLEKRWHQTLMVDLSMGDCLLYLRRYRAVLERVQAIRQLLQTLRADDQSLAAMQVEAGQALIIEAAAHAGLHHTAAALDSLSEARLLFEQHRSPVWVAACDYERAQLHQIRQEWADSMSLATAAAEVFDLHRLPTRAVQARLVVARSALGMGDGTRAEALVASISEAADALQLPFLVYQIALLQGDIALAVGREAVAIAAYERAIEAVEQLRGWLMVEMRSDFVADKQVAYESLVRLWSEQHAADRAFAIVERAKSRALLDLLAYRLDLTLSARHHTDDPLVQELKSLRREWDGLFRAWESRPSLEPGRLSQGEAPEQALLSREKRMTEIWQTLLMRDAAYARDAALWQVQTERLEAVQQHLAPGSALIEYFTTPREIYAFVMTRETLTCQRLAVTPSHIARLYQHLQLNLASVPRSTPDTITRLAVSACAGPLQQLYTFLVAPLQPQLAQVTTLAIVPHGDLHYLPFHAFYDGSAYLMEHYALSYLPSASVLPYCTMPSTGTAVVAFGYSNEGRIQARVTEAQKMATMMGGEAYLEQAATVAHLRRVAPTARLMHLATHGYFHRDNPRFSGVVLADGYLTTMDIFGLQLPGTFVALSACQTKQSHLGGGDELLGMTQAFLHAGATGLLMSQWAVSDAATLALMTHFYAYLARGFSYVHALRLAQQQLARDPAWSHPFFWAAFFLMGTPS
jgi:CHAT domain-containing protein